MAKRKTERIPAIAYLRKSTKGKRTDGREKQEKSIDQQRQELAELASRNGYDIKREYADEGVSGWKRDGKRPDFDRMLMDAKTERDFEVILCDDLDRFSRAEVMEVFSDLSALSSAGVRVIHCVNQGEFELAENDIGRIIKLVVDIHGGNDFSRKLSRRITRTRRNSAQEGVRTGGNAPYGMANDGKGGLKHGDRKQIKIVHRIFDEFVNKRRSMNSISDGLNNDNIDSPGGSGKKWYGVSVKEILKRPAYRGDFVFNKERRGKFFQIDESLEVVEATPENQQREADDAGVIRLTGVYKPLVDPKLFDKAQKRLKELSFNRGGRTRKGYALTGILFCGHCGTSLYGWKPNKGDKVVYRCGSTGHKGKSTCRTFQVHENVILPFVLRTLGEEVTSIRTLLTTPPKRLTKASRERRDNRDSLKQEQQQLTANIAIAEDNLMLCQDKRTRKSLDKKITQMRDALERIDAELSVDVSQLKVDGKTIDRYSKDELQALNKWWSEFQSQAVTMPVSKKAYAKMADSDKVLMSFHRDVFTADMLLDDPKAKDVDAIWLDPYLVNDALLSIGCKVTLRWDVTQYETCKGVVRNRYTISRGRYQLGQKQGKISQRVLQSMVTPPKNSARRN